MSPGSSISVIETFCSIQTGPLGPRVFFYAVPPHDKGQTTSLVRQGAAKMDHAVDVGQAIAEMQEAEAGLDKAEVPTDTHSDDDGRVLPGTWEIY